MQAGENIGQDVNGICGRTTEKARMQVAVGRRDCDFLADQAAKGGGDGGRIAVPHAGIAYQCIIGFQLIGIGIKERLQRGRTGFFLALEKNGDAHGQTAIDCLIGPAGFHEGHQLTLVISRSTPGDHLPAAADIFHGRFERIVFPEIERIDRLHIVMAVEKHMRRVFCRGVVMRHHHWMTGRVANGSRKAQ